MQSSRSRTRRAPAPGPSHAVRTAAVLAAEHRITKVAHRMLGVVLGLSIIGA